MENLDHFVFRDRLSLVDYSYSGLQIKHYPMGYVMMFLGITVGTLSETMFNHFRDGY